MYMYTPIYIYICIYICIHIYIYIYRERERDNVMNHNTTRMVSEPPTVYVARVDARERAHQVLS